MSDKLINSVIQNMTREELIAELQVAHSEEFVVMFLGFLSGDIPQLRTMAPAALLESWANFKREMGK